LNRFLFGAAVTTRLRHSHGALVPNAKLRREIIPTPAEQETEPSTYDAHAQGAPARLSWTRLLKRVFDAEGRVPA
jgi:hypothetical protein